MSSAPEYKINVKRDFIFVHNPNNRGFKKNLDANISHSAVERVYICRV